MRAVASHLYRFGILMCAGCGDSHEFVSYSPDCKHITDAFCMECGYVFGRCDAFDELAFARCEPGQAPGEVRRKGVPVISEHVAREAIALLIARETRRPLAAILAAGGTAPDTAAHALALLPSAPLPPADRGVHARPLRPDAAAPDGSPASSPAGRVPGPRPAGPDLTPRSRSDEFMRDFAERHGRT